MQALVHHWQNYTASGSDSGKMVILVVVSMQGIHISLNSKCLKFVGSGYNLKHM